MRQVVIENPILNSPFEEPTRHFRFTEDGITNEKVAARRVSSYFVPIPYTLDGEEHQYIPDFLVRLDDGHGPDDLLTLIVEVTGEKRKDKAAKVATARQLWVPAVNNHGGFGRWGFGEVEDPWESETGITRITRI